MKSLADLAAAARTALEVATAQSDVREIEAFAASNATLLTRLNYTSHIPCNGVEEPKSTEAFGLGLRVVFEAADGRRVGFGTEPSDLGAAGAGRALARARRAAVVDPNFVSLPRPDGRSPTLADYHDPALMALDDRQLVDAGWAVLNGALRTFLASSRLGALADSDAALRALGLIVGGDVTVLAERIALASTAMPAARTDESTIVTAFVTAMVEARDAKGSGWSTGTRLAELTDEAGVTAADNAIASIDGVRVPSGRYTIVFGRQPVTDLVNNLLVPSLSAGAFYASSTPFLGQLGRPVASPQLHVYDDGAIPGFTGSKALTCEGLATGRTELIQRGRLVGCLSCWYDTQRLLRDPQLAAKLGATGPDAEAALVPRNGFRFGARGGRSFDSVPSVAPSNVVIEGEAATSREDVLARVGDGLYVGRIWYTYPINGLRAGDFTCTVVGDSYRIRDGRLAEPLRANTLRINDNIKTILGNVVGVTKEVRGTIVWSLDEVVYAPEIAVHDVRVDAIAGFMDQLD